LLLRFNPRHPGNFYSSFYDHTATLQTMLSILAKLPDGSSEIMCHPGFADQDLMKTSSYNLQRENELNILKDPSLKTLIQDQGIQMITFNQLL
jgi:predicted glycoside hydrolase/deacetylase ChbG (UPF0249 family)